MNLREIDVIFVVNANRPICGSAPRQGDLLFQVDLLLRGANRAGPPKRREWYTDKAIPIIRLAQSYRMDGSGLYASEFARN